MSARIPSHVVKEAILVLDVYASQHFWSPRYHQTRPQVSDLLEVSRRACDLSRDAWNHADVLGGRSARVRRRGCADAARGVAPLSRTSPVRWWRDDATRYQARPPFVSLPLEAPAFDPPAPVDSSIFDKMQELIDRTNVIPPVKR